MKLAFVFPGQGSQSVGMLDSFAENPHVQSALKTANDALGENLEELIHTGPAESLNMTVNTQPAMLTASVALYQAWLAMGGKKPEVMAGHSLGVWFDSVPKSCRKPFLPVKAAWQPLSG